VRTKRKQVGLSSHKKDFIPSELGEPLENLEQRNDML
jgi:hypothetical protein